MGNMNFLTVKVDFKDATFSKLTFYVTKNKKNLIKFSSTNRRQSCKSKSQLNIVSKIM